MQLQNNHSHSVSWMATGTLDEAAIILKKFSSYIISFRIRDANTAAHIIAQHSNLGLGLLPLLDGKTG